MKNNNIVYLIFCFLFIACQKSNENSKTERKVESLGENYDQKFKEETFSSIESVSNQLTQSALTSSNFALKDNAVRVKKNGTTKQAVTNSFERNKYRTKIIKTADLKLKVKDVKTASLNIANLVDFNGGYISSENLTSDKTYYRKLEIADTVEVVEYEVKTSNTIYVRVPSENFEKVMNSIKGIFVSTDYVKINSEDVTEEYVDLEIRLKTKKEVEARYIEILRRKAKTLEEILIAENKIRMIREEIESVEGRLNYLESKVSLSTIAIEIYQKVEYIQDFNKIKNYTTSDKSFSYKIGTSLRSGWNGVLWFFIGVVYFWPFVLIGTVGVWFMRKRIRSKK
mgnify:CR=1 FL=1